MSLPTTYKAAVLPAPYAQHTIEDRTLPTLEANQVAIKITATAVNPVDWKIRDYNVFLKTYPAVLGSDAAGEIVAIGPSVTSHAVGDRVFFQGIIGHYPASTFQQYCVMPAELVATTPAGISDDQAAGISLASVAVVTGFYDQTGHGIAPPPWTAEGGAEAGKGKAIAILGGASSVGQYAIQFARLSGFERIITTASAAHHEFLKGLGAHVVLDRQSATAPDFVAAAGEGVKLSYVYDAISVKETQKLGVEIAQATQGTTQAVVTVQAVDQEAAQLGQSQEPKVAVKPILGLGSSPALRHLSEPMVKALGGEEGWIAKGLFVPNRVRLIPGGLGAVEKALKTNKEGVSGEKVVFRPNDA
ncbi:zinc-binding alcohol dehydrogenase family protein [Aspergillus saccharolyticus JOP 1030-1]|uniref:GroES-like protein n=1 Tax=Aspergillus saccharolyticus JOP 1030-1 TaxID=1450539 RepID=A0A318Z5E9_9EURO|nr:GroES-like protein [Aspergillus saccharolyticus JOP 1030-1]PYH42541.1 GroES-like protein [Aspergillus saccharolyticus JOP 1030-1]